VRSDFHFHGSFLLLRHYTNEMEKQTKQKDVVTALIAPNHATFNTNLGTKLL
jgi:hypothetical protein